MGVFRSTKTYGHELGLSCAFRQWRAKHSHCRFLHGYALSITLTFEAPKPGMEGLDGRNWVMDFGGLSEVKAMLFHTFDHKTLVAEDDPEIAVFRQMQKAGVVDLVVMPRVGCEAFAEEIHSMVDLWLLGKGYSVKLISVEVREHGANSAIYKEN